ncbi:MAG: hypothetical protein PHH85_01975 [Candidatus Methanoperedens sp.]|nr:hypothetical protein [Candidatus Methanoperedens sp.]
MNTMEQIMNDMRNRNSNGATQQAAQTRPCGCTAARAKTRRTGITVKVIGRPPGTQAARVVRQQPQRHGPPGGFARRLGTPPELQGGRSGTLIKVERRAGNLMDEIMAELRKR